MREMFLRLLRYDAWATGRVLDLLQAAGAHEGRARELVAHLIIARRVWLTRIRGEDSSAIALWPSLSLAECRTLLDETQTEWVDLLTETPEPWDRHMMRYRNNAGQEFVNSLADIVMHLGHHGAYHRGQLAAKLRDAGIQPINTDYITYVRQQTHLGH